MVEAVVAIVYTVSEAVVVAVEVAVTVVVDIPECVPVVLFLAAEGVRQAANVMLEVLAVDVVKGVRPPEGVGVVFLRAGEVAGKCDLAGDSTAMLILSVLPCLVQLFPE